MLTASEVGYDWLNEEFGRLTAKRKFWSKKTRLYRWLSSAGALGLFFGTIGSIKFVDPESWVLSEFSLAPFLAAFWGPALILLGGTAILLGGRVRPNPYPPQLSIEEQSYIRLFPVFSNIDLFVKQNNEAAKFEAARQLRKLSSYMKENWNYGNMTAVRRYVGKALIKLEIRFRDRLIPFIESASRANVEEALQFLRLFAKFLIEPEPNGVDELNTHLEKFPTQTKELEPARHPPMEHILAFGATSLGGVAVYVLGQALRASVDISYFAAVTFMGAVIGGYIAVSRRTRQ